MQIKTMLINIALPALVLLGMFGVGLLINEPISI